MTAADRDPEMMTPQESKQWGTALCVALADDDDARVAEGLASFEPCAANFRLALTAMAAMTRAVQGVLEPASLGMFVAPVFGLGLSEGEVCAGQILATTHNDAHETTQDLITDLFRRAEAHPDQSEAGPRLVTDTLICLMETLRGVLHELRDREEGQSLRCVHCGCLIIRTIHAEGSYTQLQRCGEESGLPYGYAAHLPGTPCPPHCLGSRTEGQ